MLALNKIDPIELRYFLAGNTAVEISEPNPIANGTGWLKDAAWKDILGLREACPNLSWITSDLKTNSKKYQKIFESTTPRDDIVQLLESQIKYRFQELVLLMNLFTILELYTLLLTDIK